LTITPETPLDVEALYHELLERFGPSARAELVRLLLEDGARSGTITTRR
jgi:plasmid stabilization system protein ParE